METVTCQHRATIKSLGHGIELEECGICHQKIQRNVDKLKLWPTVTQLGRIDGKIVLPNPDYKLVLLPRDQADLAAAKATTKPAAIESPTKSPADRPKDQKGRLKWYKDHKKEMIDDLITMGKKAFLKKWSVPPQLLSHLQSDEYYEERKAPPAKSRLGTDTLPPLPSWNDNWAPEVQVRWLTIYEKLISKE